MATLTYLLPLSALLMITPSCTAWYYHSTSNAGSSSSHHGTGGHLLKQQFLLPPYPTYQHELIHQPPPPPSITVQDNRYYGAPGEFAEPTSYNELSFEGPYEVTAPRIPGLYFRLSSGVFVPVKAVYQFPPFLERVIQRIQGYYSVYNPPETLGLDRPIPDGVPIPPTLDVLPVIPPQHPDVTPEVGQYPPPPPPPPPGPLPATPGPLPATPEPPKPDEPTDADENAATPAPSSTTTESSREETTPPGQTSDLSAVTESIESTTDAPVEETTASS